jgi:hypothetical protein
MTRRDVNLTALAIVAATIITTLCLVAALIVGIATIAKADTGVVAGCQTIGYTLNVTAVPDPNRVTAIRDAVAMVQSRTGNAYRYDGTTNVIPTQANLGGQTEQLVIAVVTPAQSDILTMYGPGAAATLWQSDNGTTVTRAAILFDAASFNTRNAGIDFAHHVSDFTVAEHELGHSVGLDHSASMADIMYPRITPATPIWYSTGDNARLAANGCVK